MTGACQAGCTRFENCEKFSTKRRKRRPGEQTRQQPLNSPQVAAELMRKQFSSGFPRTKGRKEKKRTEEESRREEKRREKRAHCVSICTCLVKKKKQQHNYWLFFPLVLIYISASESIRCCLNGRLGWLVVSRPPRPFLPPLTPVAPSPQSPPPLRDLLLFPHLPRPPRLFFYF